MAHTVSWKVFEIIEKVAKATKKQDKINILRQHNNNWALKDILRGTYDDAVQWNLPKGDPPYEPAPEDTHPSNLTQHNKKFANFVKGGPGDKLQTYRREKIFLDILETIHPQDAILMLGMIAKQNIKGVTKALVSEAYPDLILK